MLFAVAALALAAAPPASVPLALAEGQVVALRFRAAVDQVALSDLGVVQVKAAGKGVEVTGVRAGFTTLVVQLENGDGLSYDVQVAAARRSGPSGPAVPLDPNAISLRVGEERHIPAAGATRLLLEENGVARVVVERDALVVTGLRAGSTSVVVIDAAGKRTTYPVSVR